MSEKQEPTVEQLQNELNLVNEIIRRQSMSIGNLNTQLIEAHMTIEALNQQQQKGPQPKPEK